MKKEFTHGHMETVFVIAEHMTELYAEAENNSAGIRHGDYEIKACLVQYNAFREENGSVDTRDKIITFSKIFESVYNKITKNKDHFDLFDGCWDFEYIPQMLFELAKISKCWLIATEEEVTQANQNIIDNPKAKRSA